MKTLKERFEEVKNDPTVRNSKEFKEIEALGDAVDDLTLAITQTCMDYVAEHRKDDKKWAHTILISLARATCHLIHAIERSAEQDKDVFAFYYDELLPLCKEVADKECVAVEEKIWRKKEIPFITKEAFILAVADPDMSVEDIISKFCKKDMSEEVRKQVVKEITELRKNRAEDLRALRELHDLRKKAETQLITYNRYGR